MRKLREADRLLAECADVDQVCRHLEVSVQTTSAGEAAAPAAATPPPTPTSWPSPGPELHKPKHHSCKPVITIGSG